MSLSNVSISDYLKEMDQPIDGRNHDADENLFYADNCDENIRVPSEYEKQLLSQNESLKRQINEALQAANIAEQIKDEKTKITKENLALKQEISNLKKRNDICTKITDDLKERLKNIEAERNEEQQTSNAQLIHLNEHIENQQIEIDVFKAQLESSENKLKEKTEECYALLKEANFCFNNFFASIPELTNFLQHYKIESPKYITEVQSSPLRSRNDQNSGLNPEDYVSAINLLKEKVQQSKIIKKKLAEEILYLKNELQLQKKEADATQNNLRNDLNNCKKQCNSIQIEKEQKISELESSNQILQDKIKMLNDTIPILKQNLTSSISLQKIDQPSEEEIESMKTMINDLQNNLKKAAHKNSKLKKHIASLVNELKNDEQIQAQMKNEMSEMQKSNLSFSDEFTKITLEKDDLLMEIQSLKTKIQQIEAEQANLIKTNKHLKDKVNNYHNDLSKARINQSTLENLVNKQKSEISMLLDSKNTMEEMIKNQNKAIKEIENKFADQDEENKILNSQINTLKLLNSNLASEQIPSAAWFNADLPKDLCAAIVEIGKNEQEPQQQKIKQTLSTIAQYINQHINPNFSNSPLKSSPFRKLSTFESQNYDEKSDILKDLLNILNRELGEPLITANDFYDNPNEIMQTVEDRFIDIANKRAQRDDENEQIYNSYQKILHLLEANSIESAEKMIESLKNDSILLSQQVDHLKSTNKKIKITYNDLLYEFENMKKQANKEISTKNTEINKLKDENSQMESDQTISQNKINHLQQEIQRLNEEQQLTLSNIENEQLSNIENLQKDFFEKLKKKDDLISSEKLNNQKVIQKLIKTKKRNSSLKQKIHELNEKISQLNDKTEQILKDSQSQTKEEIKEIENKCNGVVQKVKKENEEKENQLQNCQTKMKTMKDTIKSLTAKKKKVENSLKFAHSQISAIKEELEREKQISNAKIKNLTFANEMKYISQIESCEAKAESMKNEIYNNVVSTFCLFYEPREKITDEYFNIILNNVREKLETYSKLENVIRRKLGILSTEQIDVIITKLNNASTMMNDRSPTRVSNSSPFKNFVISKELF
ncbi:hypothetical protein TRFO_25717 [Tritrichomonas foetus]|uniref:Uncharacterized protein n=1 Tax=Tritrichomonas foetus TaxID=1144522 RepID=A0A1J4K4W6_9EUKA|nr:hypothetical protein TRFO_25717 [Tritrichomonas foetus]|eukprot:OHT06243.1 hypothetical protein TRFO_25717 [Tritrichomonas foetus]